MDVLNAATPPPLPHPSTGPPSSAMVSSPPSWVSPRTVRALADLGRIHLDEGPLEHVLTRIAELAQAAVPGADEASLTVLDDGAASTLAATSDRAARLDARQYERGTGPCLDAARSGTTISLRIDREARYVDFAAVGWDVGLQASASVGVPATGRGGAALNLYDFTGVRLDEASLDLARLFAGFVAVALARSARPTPAASARDVVEQAKGVLVARLRCTPDAAAGFLQEQARATRTHLVEVAASTVRAAQRGAVD